EWTAGVQGNSQAVRGLRREPARVQGEGCWQSLTNEDVAGLGSGLKSGGSDDASTNPKAGRRIYG
ncbi:MAG TPA: hypothetical protein VGR64_10665, partial [Terracidiphilus sp.]|nr:hypothetical protein [Terracidiphilus sp.]